MGPRKPAASEENEDQSYALRKWLKTSYPCPEMEPYNPITQSPNPNMETPKLKLTLFKSKFEEARKPLARRLELYFPSDDEDEDEQDVSWEFKTRGKTKFMKLQR